MLEEYDQSRIQYQNKGTTNEKLDLSDLGGVAATVDILFETYGMNRIGPALGLDITKKELNHYIVPLVRQYAFVDTHGWTRAQNVTHFPREPFAALDAYYRHSRKTVTPGQSALQPEGEITQSRPDYDLFTIFPCPVGLRTLVMPQGEVQWTLYELVESENNRRSAYPFAQATCAPFKHFTEHKRPPLQQDASVVQLKLELPTARWVDLMNAAIFAIKDPDRFAHDAHTQDISTLLLPQQRPRLLQI